MVRKVLLGTLVAITVLAVGGAIFLYTAVNRNIDEHFAGACTPLELPGSAEDMDIDREHGFAYLSVYDRGATARGEVTIPGSILRLDLNSMTPGVENALLDGPEDLHPHGISLHTDSTGQRHLFVINHPADRENGEEAIERYTEAQPGLFRHAETLKSPLITRANDLVATGPRQFYVAQDNGQGAGEPLTKLVYFDGENFTVVADDIESGGGINVSADNRTLYIAETNAKVIRVARRDLQDGSLETTARIQLETSPDNINVAADGTLIVGAHSNLVALVMHFIAGSPAPTQILRVDPATSPAGVEEIYLNAGGEISTGSGAATYGKRLLIGSITDKKLLLCEFSRVQPGINR